MKSRLPVGGPQRAQSINKPTIPSVAPRERLFSKHTTDNSKRPELTKVKQVPQAKRPSKIEQVDNEQPTSFAFSRETIEPRLELLHAHAIHRSSSKVQKEWEMDARRHYEKQFLALQEKDSELDAKEMEFLEQRNAAAILSLSQLEDGTTIEQQVRKLSSRADEVWRLTGRDGKYTLAIQAFEHWFDAASSIHRRRRREGIINGMDVIEGLGDGWKAEIAALTETVYRAATELLELKEVTPTGSDSERCICTIKESINNMIDELELVAFIEEHTMQQERSWVQGSINAIASGLQERGQNRESRLHTISKTLDLNQP